MSSQTSPSSAARRFTFMVAVIPFLIERGSASLDELAERFDLTPQAVRRLVEIIAMSGVPGETATYQDNDLFDIDWDALDRGEVILTKTIAIDRIPKLSNVEIASIIAGLQLIDSTLDASSAAVAESVLHKLNVHRDGREVGQAFAAEDLRLLRSAIDARHTVQFDYVDARGEVTSARRVDPLWMDRYDQGWYLRGWSQAQQAIRTFRVERISALGDTGETFTDDHAAAQLTLESSPQNEYAIVRVHPTALGFLSWFADAPRTVDPVTGEIIAEIPYASPAALVRSIMAYPGRVIVEQGDEIRSLIATRAEAALARYAL